MTTDPVDAWLTALIDRHMGALSTPEFLKAVRALSARYVERRSQLPHRSPTDSAGKRAAFSGFFAPIHFFTTRAVVSAVGATDRDIREIVDLGCGTGAASAAWALAFADPPAILGVDRQPWALDEAAWNWRALGLSGRTRRADLVRTSTELAGSRLRPGAQTALLLAWSVNELDDRVRDELLLALLAAARSGRAVLVIEPIARRASPWWNRWVDACGPCGGRATEWKFADVLPDSLIRISEAAGFQHGTIGARTLWLPG